MWTLRYLRRIDWRVIPCIGLIMGISILVIAATTGHPHETGWAALFTPMSQVQLRWYVIGWCVYFFFAALDYTCFRRWAWVIFLCVLLALIGLFFVAPIQNVHRWYRIPGLGMGLQPSEYAKLALVIVLSHFLADKSGGRCAVAWQALGIAGLPFVLILKQPDLGTSLVLFPIVLVIFYFSGVHKRIVFWMQVLGIGALLFVSLMFLGVLSHDTFRPIATTVLKEYQYERLNPHTYHQEAAQTAIGLGGWTGTGWRKSGFTGRQWLPAAATDSVFPAYAEEFGVVGIFFLLLFFFVLLYLSFQVIAVSKDRFGQLLSAGISVYLSVHVVVNMGMMAGYLPITGVPLLLVTYGGSSILATMMALGILQSIYSRRFIF